MGNWCNEKGNKGFRKMGDDGMVKVIEVFTVFLRILFQQKMHCKSQSPEINSFSIVLLFLSLLVWYNAPFSLVVASPHTVFLFFWLNLVLHHHWLNLLQLEQVQLEVLLQELSNILF